MSASVIVVPLASVYLLIGYVFASAYICRGGGLYAQRALLEHVLVCDIPRGSRLPGSATSPQEGLLELFPARAGSPGTRSELDSSRYGSPAVYQGVLDPYQPQQ